MNLVYINGRPATPAEAAAVRKGYDDARERDMRALAGVLTETPDERVPQARELPRQSPDLGRRRVTELAPLS